jgi:hypothetical protein
MAPLISDKWHTLGSSTIRAAILPLSAFGGDSGVTVHTTAITMPEATHWKCATFFTLSLTWMHVTYLVLVQEKRTTIVCTIGGDIKDDDSTKSRTLNSKAKCTSPTMPSANWSFHHARVLPQRRWDQPPKINSLWYVRPPPDPPWPKHHNKVSTSPPESKPPSSS